MWFWVLSWWWFRLIEAFWLNHASGRHRVGKLEKELGHYLREDDDEEEEEAGPPMPRRHRPPAPAGGGGGGGDTTLPLHSEEGEEEEVEEEEEAGEGLVTALEQRVTELEAECEVLSAEGQRARRCVPCVRACVRGQDGGFMY